MGRIQAMVGALLVVAFLGAASAFTPPFYSSSLSTMNPKAFQTLPPAPNPPAAATPITGLGMATNKNVLMPPSVLNMGWPFRGEKGTDNIPLPYSVPYASTLHGFAGMPYGAGPDSTAFLKKDLPPVPANVANAVLPVQTKATTGMNSWFNPAPIMHSPVAAPYGMAPAVPLPATAPVASPAAAATAAAVMPALKGVPAPLTTLPKAAPLSLPQTGYGFPHGALFGIGKNGKMPKGFYSNVAEPKNVDPYSPATVYDAYNNAVTSYKYYQHTPYVGLHPAQVPVTHVKSALYGIVPAALYPGKVFAAGDANGKVKYFNSDPASTEAVHSWPAFGKHSTAQTNQILQTRYLAENQKVGTLAVNGLAHAVSANIAQNQAHNKMQASALEQILKETEEQKSAVSEALAQVEKTIKPVQDAVNDDSDKKDDNEDDKQDDASGSSEESSSEESTSDQSSSEESGSGSDSSSEESSSEQSGSGSEESSSEESSSEESASSSEESASSSEESESSSEESASSSQSSSEESASSSASSSGSGSA